MDKEQEQLDALSASLAKLKEVIFNKLSALQAEITKQHDQIADLLANGSQDSSAAIAAQRQVVDDMINQLLGEVQPTPVPSGDGSAPVDGSAPSGSGDASSGQGDGSGATPG